MSDADVSPVFAEDYEIGKGAVSTAVARARGMAQRGAEWAAGRKVNRPMIAVGSNGAAQAGNQVVGRTGGRLVRARTRVVDASGATVNRTAGGLTPMGYGVAGGAAAGLTGGAALAATRPREDVGKAFAEDYEIGKADDDDKLSGKEKAGIAAGVIGTGVAGAQVGQARAVGGYGRARAINRNANRQMRAVLAGDPRAKAAYRAQMARAERAMGPIQPGTTPGQIGMKATRAAMNASGPRGALMRGGMKGGLIGYGAGALGAGAYVASRKIDKALDVSGTFTEDYEIGKAKDEEAKPSRGQGTPGRIATGTLFPGFHGAIAGRKGKKLKAAAVPVGGAIAGYGAGAGLGALVRKPSMGANVGSLAGAGAGTVYGNKRGWYKRQAKDAF